jgi:hypothetical protein
MSWFLKKKDFQTKKIIDQVYKAVDKNDIDTFKLSKRRAIQWTLRGKKKHYSDLLEGKETHNQMMIQWNPSKLWLASVNDKCLLMIDRRISIIRSVEGNVAKNQSMINEL